MPMLLACNTQRIWPAIEVTLSFPGRLLSGRTGGHGTRLDPSRLDLFSAGEHSGRWLNGAGFPPHPSKPHNHVSGPLCSRVLDRRYDPQWQDLTGFFPAPMPPAARCSIPTARAPRGIASACSSGIRQPAATGQAIILSFSVADDVVASISPEKAAKLLRWKSPRHSPPLLDGLSGRVRLCGSKHGRTALSGRVCYRKVERVRRVRQAVAANAGGFSTAGALLLFLAIWKPPHRRQRKTTR